MSTLQFPKNPSINDEYDWEGFKYVYDGQKWKTIGVGYNPVNDLKDKLEPRIDELDDDVTQLQSGNSSLVQAVNSLNVRVTAEEKDTKDWEGFTAELLAQAGIVDDGQPDEIGNSQRVEAIKQLKIIADGSTTPRRLGDRFADVVNVKDFGAKGDGFTNDTAAFIAARGAWDSGTLRFERVVEIPTGKYFLTEDVIGDWVSDSVLSFTNGFYPILQNNGDSKISVGNIIVGTKALPFTGSYRDAFQVSRYINGQTDCHGFADKTTLNPTDAGTYGVFDATVTMKSAGVVNHIFAFQNRNVYDGTGGGTLENYIGMIHWPSSMNGTIDTNIGVQIRDVEAGESTFINTNIGVDVADLNGITSIGFRSLQEGGHSFYAPNGGKIYNKGAVGIGLPALTGYPLSVSSDNGSTVARLAASDNIVALMSQYNNQIQLINNASNVCLRVKASTGQYAVTPGVDNAQPLGDVAHRWSTVFAGTGAINTSDEREKTTLIDISEVEKACALELKQNIKKFKFIDAVNKKGDSARIHFGVGAQTVKTIFESHGLNADDYALFCYDEWEANDDDGVIAGSRYGVRYSELAIFILSAI